MADSSPAASPAPDRRRSGRAITKPSTYQDDPDVSTTTNGSTKRKRGQRVEDDGEESDGAAEHSDNDQPRKSKSKAKGRKPANKKPKTGQTTLAMRPATNGTRQLSKAKKARGRMSGVNENSLYAQVFLSGSSTAEVAQRWLEDYDKDNTAGLCKLVNFALKCTGCDLEVEIHDIEDPDNAPNKLTDLQEEYQSQNITDYPLIQKTKGNVFSRKYLEAFFHDLMETLHRAGTLYDDKPLYPSIENWIVPMTSSPIRPFRHTATVITNALTSAFCEVMKDLDEDLRMTTRAKQQEEKSKKKAKDKLSSYQAKLSQLEERKADVDKWIRELFDSTFVHRYRDIDPRIRSDCAEALGSWMEACPDIFFEAQYLRYLGWLMSDLSHSVRHHVLAQFQRLYSVEEPDIGRLRAFTQRFRDRMVEVATRDSEINIRVLALDLVDSVRSIGLLESEHIDTIGRLVFDVEPKIRRAVAPFFASNVQDAYDNITEALGAAEGLEDAIGAPDEDDYDSPRPVWLKYKSIAQLLDEYDAEDEETQQPAAANSLVSWVAVPSRYTSAAEVVYEGIPEVQDDWPMLAGYLLYDATAKSVGKKRKSQDPLELFKQRCDLTDKQEKLLLEVLVVAVQKRQAEAAELRNDKKSKKSKTHAEQIAKGEINAHNVVAYLPRLLYKYGADPASAAIVLRMAQSMPLEDLTEDSTEYEALLNDIGKQFLSHSDPTVLEEASAALLYASKNEDLEEATATKIQELWEKTFAALQQNARARNTQLEITASNVLKISKLTDISDPNDVFTKTKNPKAKDGSGSLLDLLIGLIETYGTTEDAEAEAVIVRSAIAITKYYMWAVRSIQEQLISSSDVAVPTVPARQRFTQALTEFITQRHRTDKSRLAAISALLDCHTIFATLRTAQVEDEETAKAISDLIHTISLEGESLILSSFSGLEKQLAKKLGKTLDDSGEDGVNEAPESDEEEDVDEDVDEETQTQKASQRQQARLLLERALCELTGKIVLAILARVIDVDGMTPGAIRKRLSRNKTKLGPNFKEVVSYLDGPKSISKKAESRTAAKTIAVKSAPVVEIEEEEEDEIEDVEEGGEDDLRRRGLLTGIEDDIEDDGNDDQNNAGGAGVDEDDDDIMGD